MKPLLSGMLSVLPTKALRNRIIHLHRKNDKLSQGFNFLISCDMEGTCDANGLQSILQFWYSRCNPRAVQAKGCNGCSYFGCGPLLRNKLPHSQLASYSELLCLFQAC